MSNTVPEHAHEAACPLCGRAGEGPLARHSDFSASSIYSCSNCRHIYCRPEPSDSVLAEHYRTAYAERRRMYLGRPYRIVMMRRAKAQADFISRFVQSGRCVDAGCGIGALVAEMAGRGWNARGFDGDAEVVQYGASYFKAPIGLGDLSEFLAEESSADLLCLSHVVEHLRDLPVMLSGLAARVRPGGCVFIEVPNQPAPPTGDMESHLHFFSKKSLSAAVQAAGLQVLDCRGCGPLADAPPPLPAGLVQRLARSVSWRVGHLLQRTEWDGWYDRYHEGDVGMWLRCIARRPARALS
jgi:2-polyprenyl-3-methyl-5-hydroxy-6-metoxy-1,4-benzoquinol methylase